jgi:hypothetical protein
MTKMHDQRAEAIARITAVRDEVLAREAAKPQPKAAKPQPKPKAAKPIREMKMDEASVKKREQRRKWKQSWVARNPDKAKQMKAKESKRYKAAVKARMEADPEYRKQKLAHQSQWPCRQNRTTTNRATRMTDDDKSILDKIKAGEADIKDLTNAELKAKWAAAVKVINAASDDCHAVSRIHAEYNRKNYLKLHRTKEGKQQYDLVQSDIDATAAKARESFDAALAACGPYTDEFYRRGLTAIEWGLL